MQGQGYKITKNVNKNSGKVVKIVQISSADTNYVTKLQGYNTNNSNTLLSYNQSNFTNKQNTPQNRLLLFNKSDKLSIGKQINSLNLNSGLNINCAQLGSRKPCNCTKSHCLKLYCECFANGQMCDMCNCTSCMNNLHFEDERGRAIKMTLDRNPTAFHPKIGRGEGERKHTKGCNCKRSGCLKNYCECYEAKVSCADGCKCVGCKNTEDSVERRSMKRLAVMTSLKSIQPNAITRNLVKPLPERLPHSFLTWEIIESITNCLIAKAEEIEKSNNNVELQEKALVEIFGIYLNKVIETSRAVFYNTNVAQFSNITIKDQIIDIDISNDFIRSMANKVRREHIMDSKNIICEEEDDELDVDLEDGMVMHCDNYGEDSEIIYNERHPSNAEYLGGRLSRHQERLNNNVSTAKKPYKSTSGREYHFLSSNRSRSRRNLNTQDDF